MNKIIKIAVDAMGGDGSPKKVIDGINHHYKNNKILFIKFLVIRKNSKLYNELPTSSFEIIHTKI